MADIRFGIAFDAMVCDCVRKSQRARALAIRGDHAAACAVLCDLKRLADAAVWLASDPPTTEEGRDDDPLFGVK